MIIKTNYYSYTYSTFFFLFSDLEDTLFSWMHFEICIRLLG